MPGHLLIDNWTLQNAGELLHSGLVGETAHEMVFSADGQSFSYTDISQDAVALECLCQLLHDVVFAETLFVDGSFVSSWEEFPSIASLARECVLIRKPFKDLEGQWRPYREIMANQLCVCPEVRRRHEQNKAEYAVSQQSSDQMLAQLIWGGAGMLARADYFRVPYVPHPLRERLLARAKVLAGPRQAGDQLRSVVETQRLKLLQRIDESGFLGQIKLPPVVIQILHAASTLDELIPAALEFRAKYRELRGWLSEFQTALDADDINDVLSHRKLLESVSRNVDELSRIDPAGDTSMQFGVSWLKVSTKVESPVNLLRDRFGVRAQIKSLMLAPAGQTSLRKLLKLLGEDYTERGMALQRDFMKRHLAE